MSEEDEGEQFEVETILNHKREKGKLKFKIRWKNFGPDDDTWEKESNVHCKDLLKEYWERQEIKARKGTPMKRRIVSSSSEASMNMDDVFDKAPETPPIVDDDQMPGPSTKKTTELEKAITKDKQKKKSKRDKEVASSSTSSKKDKDKKKKKKKKAREDSETDGSPISTNAASSKIPPLILIMSETAEKNLSRSPSATVEGETKRDENVENIEISVPIGNENESPDNNNVTKMEEEDESELSFEFPAATRRPQVIPFEEPDVPTAEDSVPSPPQRIITEGDGTEINMDATVTPDLPDAVTPEQPFASLPTVSTVQAFATTPEPNLLPSTSPIRPFSPDFLEQSQEAVTQAKSPAIAQAPEIIQSPTASSMPPSHICFGTSPTVYEYASNAQVHNINHYHIMQTLSKVWKLRCLECTSTCLVTDETIEYAFALLTANSQDYFIIKIENKLNELFLIDGEDFSVLCPKKFGFFAADHKNYYDTLDDVTDSVEQQKQLVAAHYLGDGILHPFMDDPNATFENSPISYESPRVQEAIRDIVELFILELQLAIGQFMARTVDSSDLFGFALNFYNTRDPMFGMVKKEVVEQYYEMLYANLMQKPSSYS